MYHKFIEILPTIEHRLFTSLSLLNTCSLIYWAIKFDLIHSPIK